MLRYYSTYISSSLCVVLLLIGIAGCGAKKIGNSDLEKYDTEQTEDETDEGDFTFTLISEKDSYDTNEKVEMYGELEYTGNKDEVTIRHSSPVIHFPMEEKERNFPIDYSIADIDETTVLKQEEPLRESYEKEDSYFSVDMPESHTDFVDDFMGEIGFPPGYYVMEGEADFTVESEKDSEDETDVNLETTVDFKVLEE